MHRIPAKMRDFIPHYFAEEMKSNTATLTVGLIIKLLRSKDNDAFWKTSKLKVQSPGNRITITLFLGRMIPLEITIMSQKSIF